MVHCFAHSFLTANYVGEDETLLDGIHFYIHFISFHFTSLRLFTSPGLL